MAFGPLSENTLSRMKITFAVIASIGLIFLLGFFGMEQLEFKEINAEFIKKVLLPLSVFAFLIEVYARLITNLIIPINETSERFKEDNPEKEKLNLWIRTVLSFLIAAFGVNVLVYILAEAEPKTSKMFFKGLDIILTTGLLASGSAGIKNLIDLIRAIIGGGIQRMNIKS